MAEITLSGISKTFDKNVEAVCDVDLEVADGELLVLVGPSGCGKSTLLRMVAGLEEVTAGSVVIGGREVTDLPPKQRDIAMVFQNYALYPHMSVRKNIGYPLRLAKVPKADLDQRVEETAQLLQLEAVLDRRPSQLSGGQRQRVAMGRALVREPQVFLMDEPLSNLDAKLRVEMRAEIAKIQRELGITTLYVTHDQTEAMTMGTRVAVLDKGLLQQIDTPQNVYDAPVNRFVASFIGSPAMNMMSGRLARGTSGPTHRTPGDNDFVVEIDGQQLVLNDDVMARNPGVPDYVGREILMGIRPEALADVALDPAAPSELTIEASVVLVESLGAELVVHSTMRGPDGSVPLVSRLTPKSRMQPGDTVKLVVDPDGLHLFDGDTGLSLRTGVAPALLAS